MFEFQDLFARVFRFALSVSSDREWAEDIAQECVIRALAKDVIRVSDSGWEWCDSNIGIGWLFKVARNMWLDQVKSADFKRKSNQSIDHLSAQSLVGRNLELQEEVCTALTQMMKLPDTQRQVLYLRAIEEMSLDEISSTLGISRGSVKTNLSLARAKMRDQQQQNYL